MNYNARAAAFDILLQIEKNFEYSNIGLDKALSTLQCDRRDKAFITNIVNGVCERRITLDYNIKKYLSSPKTRLKADVRTILRMGAYEIFFCDGIPARASVYEYVQLTKNRKAVHSVGMINAVLRRIAENGLVLPDEHSHDYYGVKYSFPYETVEFFKKIYGENTEKFLSSSIKKPRIYGRINTLKTDFSTLYSLLSEEGIEIEKSDMADNAFFFKNTASFMNSSAFKNGFFHIQDISSQLCCHALRVHNDMQVLDVCAAPGGKSFTVAELMNGTGNVYSCDIHKHKIGLIQQGASRLGLNNIVPELRDATDTDVYNDMFDRVLCDVPCSGFGVIAKKSEIKYRNLNEIKCLPDLQYKILEASARKVKANGLLVYSTCTVLPSENTEVIKKFLENHSDFRIDKDCSLPIGTKTDFGFNINNFDGDCDGFFIAPLTKK